MDAQLWFDGACTGNPGPMGAGAVLRMGGRVREVSQAKGRGTNNEAEYHGLIEGLKAALAAGAKTIKVMGDSQLVLRQLEGRYAVKAANLQPLHREAAALLARFERVDLEWVRRDANAMADAAARRAIE